MSESKKSTYTFKCPVCGELFPADCWASSEILYLEHCKTAPSNTPWGNHFRTSVKVRMQWYDDSYEEWEDSETYAYLGDDWDELNGVGGPYSGAPTA